MHDVLLHWSFDWNVWLGAVLAVLAYAGGLRYSIQHGLARHVHSWRSVATVVGIIGVIIALQSPIDYWSDSYLWVHMLQHEILTMIAAPLVALGAPWLIWWRIIPLRVRRSVARGILTTDWLRRPLGDLTRWFSQPRVAWVVFVGDFALWHLPRLYDLTLQDPSVHYLEHVLFLGTAVLFWVQILPAPPFRSHLSRVNRVAFLGAALLFGTMADEIFIAAPYPLYSYYAALPRAAGAISAMTDQSIAGGVMDAMNGLVLVIALIALWRWTDRRASPDVSPAQLHGRQIDPAPSEHSAG